MKPLFFTILLLLFCKIQTASAQVQQTAAAGCTIGHFGSFIFSNSTKGKLDLTVLYCFMPENGNYPAFKSTTIYFSLAPGETKLLGRVMISPGVRNNFVIKSGGVVIDEGDFLTEECETRTQNIK
jgi:hypothetical protein